MILDYLSGSSVITKVLIEEKRPEKAMGQQKQD